MDAAVNGGAECTRADDPFHNVYHTLKRFFTGDDKHASAAYLNIGIPR